MSINDGKRPESEHYAPQLAPPFRFTDGRLMRTSLFLFADENACECGERMSGNYVELPNEPPGAARALMMLLRGRKWSHQHAPSDLHTADEIRATHVRIPLEFKNRPCFCGGHGEPYASARARGAK